MHLISMCTIGHQLPSGLCNVTVGDGGVYNNHFYNYGGDSLISVDDNTLYLTKGGGCGARAFYSGVNGGCGGGAAQSFNRMKGTGGSAVSENIINGVNGIGPIIQTTYAVLGNKGGNQDDSTIFTDNAIYGTNKSCPGGGGIGSIAANHDAVLEAGPGGDGLNEVRINDISYNFKSYFANDNPFGHNDNGYIGGGGGGASFFSLTQAPGGIGGGGKGTSNLYVNYSWRESLKDFYSLNPNNPTTGPTSGAMNTGSGGGGGGFYSRSGDSSGGSGIVNIRYRT